MEAATIGQYRVTGVLGRGGMGAVYAAEHALLGRPAAIKVLLPELSQKQDVVMRFFNEARAATAIRHPGIIEIYDFGWTPDGAAFIVMERLEGDTLARRSQRSRFRWPAVLAIARQIAGALAAAHAKGIVHRDLKPDNVFLVPDPEVPGGERIKLLDFGIAKLAMDSPGTVNVTKTGSVMGTPTYMAPEQCRGVAVDHRADLYALGCVIYELCCGRPPFVGEGTGDVLAAHIHLPVPEMSGAIAEIPSAVERLVRRLLAKAPTERVQSAEELIHAIDAVTPERTGVSTGPRSVVPVSRPPSVTTLSGSASTSMLLTRAGRRGRWSVVVFSAVLALVAAAIVAIVMRDGHDANRSASHATEPSAVAAAPPGSTQPAPPTGAPAAEPAISGPLSTSGAPSTDTVSPARPDAPPPTASASKSPSDAAPQGLPPPTTVEVAVETTPPGAQVVLDGNVLGTTPYHSTLPRRDRDVRLIVRLAGHIDKVIVARASQPIREQIKLVRSPPPPPRSAKDKRNRSVNPF